MATTNKYYHNKDYNTLYKEALLAAIDKKLLDIPKEAVEEIIKGKDIENVFLLFLSIYTKITSDYYISAQEIYESNDLQLAEGTDLDIIGQMLGLPRYKSTKASTTIEFTTTDTLDRVITVEEGVQVDDGDGKVYTTDNHFTLSNTSKSAQVNAVSENSGSDAHVKTGELNRIISEIEGINNITCTNIIPSSGGKGNELDSEYRTRLSNWRLIGQKGNEYAYKNILDNLDELEDYQLIPKWDGAGTVKVVLKKNKQDTSDIEYIRRKVYGALQEKAALFDEDLTVMAAANYPINVYCNINVDYDITNPYSLTEKNDIKEKTVEAIKDYVAQLKIGEDFIPFKCGVYLDESFESIKNIEFSMPKEPIEVKDESIITLSNVDVTIN